MPLSLDVNREQLEAAFAAAVHREVPAGDRAWAATERRLLVALRWKAFATRWLPWLERRGQSAKVSETYEEAWDAQADFGKFDLARREKQLVVWGERRFYASQLGAKRVHLLYIAALIDALRPRAVLEVGSGLGQNAMLLAQRFPDVQFTGLELTAQGTRIAAAARAAPLQEVLLRHAPFPLADADAHARVRFVRGSAAQLPFASDAFDLVYTVLALEQMEAIRAQALAEIARVCRGHTAMIEPFRDYNQTPLRRAKTQGWGLFSAAIGDLPAYGLTPMHTTGDMPMKVYYGVGLVVSEKR